MQNVVLLFNKFIMSKTCCFPSFPECPSVELEVNCVTTCCVSRTRNIEIDFVDNDIEKTEEEDTEDNNNVSLCCLKVKKRTCKAEVDLEKKDE